MEMKMTGPEKEQELSTFFLAFVGQPIIITVDMMSSIITSSEHGTVTEMVPIYYEGILLDFDEENYYLGKTSEEITDAVPKNRAIHIKVSDDEEVTTAFLKQVPIEGEMN